VVSVQVERRERRAALLIIRRSWVRAPPAPPAVLIPVAGEPWTGLYTNVGGAMFEPSGRIRSHRATLERLLARQGVRRNRPTNGRETRCRKTCMLHMQDLAGPAKIELGKLLAMARAGRQPDSDVTVWPDCSTSTYQLPDGTCPPARATSDTYRCCILWVLLPAVLRDWRGFLFPAR
jgi:hypothetical protein